MTSPRRRPFTLANLNVQTSLSDYVKRAPEIELGWSVIKDDMRDLGWRTRIPDDDARHATTPAESPAIDYCDITGNTAIRLNSLARDLEAMEGHWALVCTSLRAMATIAAKHRLPSVPAVPCCSVSQCDQPVESRITKSGPSYVGMTQIAGLWVAPAGSSPTCARHRRMRRVA